MCINYYSTTNKGTLDVDLTKIGDSYYKIVIVSS